MSHATTAEISDQDLEAVAGGGREVQRVSETKGRSSRVRRGLAHADKPTPKVLQSTTSLLTTSHLRTPVNVQYGFGGDHEDPRSTR
jgi:hypothetical protein